MPVTQREIITWRSRRQSGEKGTDHSLQQKDARRAAAVGNSSGAVACLSLLRMLGEGLVTALLLLPLLPLLLPPLPLLLPPTQPKVQAPSCTPCNAGPRRRATWAPNSWASTPPAPGTSHRTKHGGSRGADLSSDHAPCPPQLTRELEARAAEAASKVWGFSKGRLTLPGQQGWK